MTTYADVMRKCAVCGVENVYPELVSTSGFGPADLDFRPPPLIRQTIEYWVQQCRACGYCAPDISEAPSETRMIVESSRYQHQLRDPECPALANCFLCWSIIQECDRDYAAAGLAHLHAAWVCDDERKEDAARQCRRRAAELLLLAQTRQQKFGKTRPLEDALLVDVLRRAGQRDRAKHLCRERLRRKPEKTIKAILTFQLVLLAQGDTACHNAEEALKHAGLSGEATDT